jgi:hypothetical protein
VDVLVPGERGELLDPGLHVVAGDPFAGGDRREVDLVEDAFVVLDHPVGDRHAEVVLRAQDGEPEPALGAHLLLG